jgi:hypothetical protein
MGLERKRRPGTTVISGGEPLPSLRPWLPANRGRFEPGSVNKILIRHDHACRYPWGEPRRCPAGPEIGVADEGPRGH